MRQDLICHELVDYLTGELGIANENIVILIALGTHRGMTEAEMEKIVSPEVYTKIKVYNHNCLADDLAYLGKTTRGTEVYVNPLAVGRKVILIGRNGAPLMSVSAAAEEAFAGSAGKQTILQNICTACPRDRVSSTSRQRKLEGNRYMRI
jgi:nickel-dependent lactate racemase